MSTGASALSLAASAFYLSVVGAAWFALITARRNRQQRWHAYSWLALGILFFCLAMMRAFNIEHLFQSELREMLRTMDSYGARGEIQRPLAAAVLLVAAASGFWWFYRTARAIRGRRNVAVIVGLAGGASMVMLVALRLISLHPIDTLLYGPLKLNWFADLGLSAGVIAAASIYVVIVRPKR